ncbi:MAG: FAD-dependent oxidoreductase [Myxococcaceae bacterium]
MRDSSALVSPSSNLALGINGFEFADLYGPDGLRRLSEQFDQALKDADPVLANAFQTYRHAGGQGLTLPAESELLIRIAAQISTFVARLFRIEAHREAQRADRVAEAPLFEFKREFIVRRVFKKGATERPTAAEFPSLNERVQLLLRLGFTPSHDARDAERVLAESVLGLMEMERVFAQTSTKDSAREQLVRDRWKTLRAALVQSAEGKAAFGSTLAASGSDEAELAGIRGLLSLFDRWTFARALHPEGKKVIAEWSTHRVPHPLTPEALVPLVRPDTAIPEAIEGVHLRRRDGFGLTDAGMSPREVMGEVDYCIFCHEREKDSCSKGFRSKDTVVEGHTYKKNALGIPLTGCPLDERISEMHALKGKGDAIGALAMVVLDNPMCPGTGHRICNDCMKACIYQKQEPVNIPQIETSALRDVLALPYGFEIYGLLTRWNPLNIKRPYALPYVGKNVLVVGMGPAGYTLSHYLLNEGFGVVGIDGLKIEPFSDALLGRHGLSLAPIRDFGELTRALDERVLSGFGGVSEYGITVRWDKNFLTLMHLTLARRAHFRAYGGIRFGGTLTIDDAWSLGFDHIAIAAGAGKPTIIPMKNNLIRGIRKASDFLMALQLTGAFKRESLANLQVELPAIVIGGGLTGIDTATELLAYYPVQVEKMLERHETLCTRIGEAKVWERFDERERKTLETFLGHGRIIRAERARARAAGETPNFAPWVRKWGGVSLVYRRGLTESPAYRLNHEEVSKALEEGIRFVERMTPVEAIPDDRGAVSALRFERMAVLEGKLRGSGEFFTMPARTVCVAAGTSPNVTYEREFPGTFQLDSDGEYFQGFALGEETPGGFDLVPVPPVEDIGARVGFFTSYRKGHRRITFYGDNHPTYAGNVVKAMASAKDGFSEVTRLFARDVAALNFADAPTQRVRDGKLQELFARLDDAFLAKVAAVNRLTPTIVEVVIRAPFAASRFQPGQFYRLQNYESLAPLVDGTRLAMEGLALTGAWVDREKGLLSTIVLEMGSSSRLCATLKVGEPVVLMGPTGAPTEIMPGETVLLAGGGLGNAVLFSIGRSLRAAGSRVIYFAGYRQKSDVFMREEIEASADQVIWSVDLGDTIPPKRPQDATFRGNVVQAMVAFAEKQLGVEQRIQLTEVDRVIAIGSDRMMRAVKESRHNVLAAHLKKGHHAIGSINSPMQCMMKEICAQCLQRHIDPITGKETIVFSCSNQDQRLDHVDFTNLNDRLKANSVVEKMSNLWLDHLIARQPDLLRV